MYVKWIGLFFATIVRENIKIKALSSNLWFHNMNCAFEGGLASAVYRALSRGLTPILPYLMYLIALFVRVDACCGRPKSKTTPKLLLFRN